MTKSENVTSLYETVLFGACSICGKKRVWSDKNLHAWDNQQLVRINY